FIADALKAHPGKLRAIGLIDESFSDRALQDLAQAGVRGFRVNRTAKTGLGFDVARRLAERTKDLGWHVQFLLDIEDHPDADEFFGSFATEVVIDHMGRPDPAKGTNAPGFQALLRLLKSGRGWAKMSEPDRTSCGASCVKASRRVTARAGRAGRIRTSPRSRMRWSPLRRAA